MVQEFVRLDILIGKLETFSPGPRLATVEAWLVHLQGKRDNMLGVEGINRLQNQQPLQINSDYRTDIEIISPVDEQFSSPPARQLLNGVGGGIQEGGAISRLPNGILANTPTQDLANVS